MLCIVRCTYYKVNKSDYLNFFKKFITIFFKNFNFIKHLGSLIELHKVY